MSYRRHIIIDLEFNPSAKSNRYILREETIQIGAIILNEDYRELERLSILVKPELNEAVEPMISRLTGIYTEKLRDASVFSQALDTLCSHIGDERCRIYSWSSNDLYQMLDECQAKGIDFPSCLWRWMDLQMVFQRIIHFPLNQSMALSYACEMLGIHYDREMAHDALYDCELTMKVLQMLKNEDYQRSVREAKSRLVSTVERRGSTIASSCADALSKLMEKLEQG